MFDKKAYMKEYAQSDKRKASRKKYEQSAAGKAAQKKYAQSDKRKASRKKYAQSAAGKATQKKYDQSDKRAVAQYKYYSSEKGKAAWKKCAENHREKFPEKVRAREAARRLPSKPCGIEGCGVGGEKHHPNYSKPLEVVYLCHNHHKEEHRRVNSG